MLEGAFMILAGATIGFAGASAISRGLAAASAQMAVGWSARNRALTLGIPLLLVSLAANRLLSAGPPVDLPRSGNRLAGGIETSEAHAKHAHRKTLASIWLLIYRKIYHA